MNKTKTVIPGPFGTKLDLITVFYFKILLPSQIGFDLLDKLTGHPGVGGNGRVPVLTVTEGSILHWKFNEMDFGISTGLKLTDRRSHEVPRMDKIIAI